MSKTGGNYRARKTIPVTIRILKKVNITEDKFIQRRRAYNRPVSAMEV